MLRISFSQNMVTKEESRKNRQFTFKKTISAKRIRNPTCLIIIQKTSSQTTSKVYGNKEAEEEEHVEGYGGEGHHT